MYPPPITGQDTTHRPMRWKNYDTSKPIGCYHRFRLSNALLSIVPWSCVKFFMLSLPTAGLLNCRRAGLYAVFVDTGRWPGIYRGMHGYHFEMPHQTFLCKEFTMQLTTLALVTLNPDACCPEAWGSVVLRVIVACLTCAEIGRLLFGTAREAPGNT